VTISERIEAGRRERRVLTRVSRAAWRLEQAERERTWALVSARAEGISIRTWPRRSGCHPPGCTSSWPMPTWMRWTRR
jgi:predicted secreted Zn-dependent protease